MPIDLEIYVCLNSEIFALKENDIEVIQCIITKLELSTLNKIKCIHFSDMSFIITVFLFFGS